MRFLWTFALIAGCGAEPSKTSPSVEPTPAAEPAPAVAPVVSSPPAYQHRWGGLSVRDGDRLVDAPAEDVTVARGYPAWQSKGVEVDHVRLTLMTAKTDYGVGDSIHVLHVLDVSVPGRGVYIMGPKRPAGEYVDGKLATVAPEIPEYPWVATYDGVVLPSPAIDYNYDVTSYRFDAPGTHQIEWRMGKLASNVITVHVR